MRCAKCGTQNADNHRFCMKCGEELAPPRGQTAAAEQLLREAYVARLRGGISLAISKAEEALALAPDDAPGHKLLGMLYASQNQTEKAVAHLERALRLQPSISEVSDELTRLRKRLEREQRRRPQPAPTVPAPGPQPQPPAAPAPAPSQPAPQAPQAQQVAVPPASQPEPAPAPAESYPDALRRAFVRKEKAEAALLKLEQEAFSAGADDEQRERLARQHEAVLNDAARRVEALRAEIAAKVEDLAAKQRQWDADLSQVERDVADAKIDAGAATARRSVLNVRRQAAARAAESLQPLLKADSAAALDAIAGRGADTPTPTTVGLSAPPAAPPPSAPSPAAVQPAPQSPPFVVPPPPQRMPPPTAPTPYQAPAPAPAPVALSGRPLVARDYRHPGEVINLVAFVGLLSLVLIVCGTLFVIGSLLATFGIGLIFDIPILLFLAVWAPIQAELIGGNIRRQCALVTPDTYPDVYAIAAAAADRLSVRLPMLFVNENDQEINAFAYGVFTKFILINRGLLNVARSREQLSFVIGHELGHVKGHHVLVQTLIHNPLVMGFAANISWIPYMIARLVLRVWDRIAELSCDRAGLLAAGNVDASARMLIALEAGPATAERVDLTAYAMQAAGSSSAFDALSELNSTHPGTARRVLHLLRFVGCHKYAECALRTIGYRPPVAPDAPLESERIGPWPYIVLGATATAYLSPILFAAGLMAMFAGPLSIAGLGNRAEVPRQPSMIIPAPSQPTPAPRIEVPQPRSDGNQKADASRRLVTEGEDYMRQADEARAQGDQQAAQERFARAQQAWQEALRLDPSNQQAKQKLDASMSRQKLDEGLGYMRQAALPESQGNPQQARVYVEQAIQAFQEALRLDPSNQEAQQSLNNAQALLGTYGQQ